MQIPAIVPPNPCVGSLGASDIIVCFNAAILQDLEVLFCLVWCSGTSSSQVCHGLHAGVSSNRSQPRVKFRSWQTSFRDLLLHILCVPAFIKGHEYSTGQDFNLVLPVLQKSPFKPTWDIPYSSDTEGYLSGFPYFGSQSFRTGCSGL